MKEPIRELSGGLPAGQDLVFAEQPADPEMRESVSVWLFDESGAFGFPRGGVEAEASSWENRRVQANFAFADGRVLNGAGLGRAHPARDAEGRASVLGAGPISFACIEPFRRWRLVFDGPAQDGHVDQQIAGAFGPANPHTDIRLDADMMMATPAWVQDNSAEAVAKMSKAEAIEAANMGIGWRFEHLFRAQGALRIDGKSHSFRGTGLRIHRQSVRPLAGFRGHCWQSALFPDGRAFGFIAYPPREDGTAYNEGYVYRNGRMHKAQAVRIPWLRRIVGAGDDVSLELQSDLGVTRIEGSTALSTFRVGNPDIGGLNLQQSGVLYRWDDQSAYGMIERSSHESLTRIG